MREELLYGLHRGDVGCISSKWVPPSLGFVRLSTLPCRLLLCCHQPCAPPPLHMPLLVLYTDHSLSVLVSVTSFTSPVLLKRTRLQTTYFYWPDNRNTRKTFRPRIPLLWDHLRTLTRLPAQNILHRTEETPSGCSWRLLRCPTRRCQCALEKLHKPLKVTAVHLVHVLQDEASERAEECGWRLFCFQ